MYNFLNKKKKKRKIQDESRIIKFCKSYPDFAKFAQYLIILFERCISSGVKRLDGSSGSPKM